MSFNKPQAPFTDDYKERCFQAWILAGCPSLSQTQGILPDDGANRRPSEATISHWMEVYDWKGRADLINAQALARVNEELVSTKAQLLKLQFDTATALAKKAAEQLLSDKIDNSNAAVQLYFKSTAEARTLMGIDEFLQTVGAMSNEELQKAIANEIERFGIVDAIPLDEETDQIEDKSKTDAAMNADKE